MGSTDLAFALGRDSASLGEAFSVELVELGRLELMATRCRGEVKSWNGLIERYHPVGSSWLSGDQLRLFVLSEAGVVGLLGFGAAALKCVVRDTWIGWTAEQRRERLRWVINNRRFLIFPWIRCRHLASKVLALSVRRVPAMWQQCFGYCPVLFETFVDKERYWGSCYRAANWLELGLTSGRGRMDRTKAYPQTVKRMLVYPIDRRFRLVLCR